MADKKFKSGVDLQSTVKISSATPEKALILNASGELVSSTVSDTELGYVAGATSSLQDQATAAQGDATQALADASTADGKAVAAQGDATTALADAATADGKAVSAQGTADAAIPSAEKGAVNGVATLDANSLIPVSQMPPAALERLVIVADETARFALTTATVQDGDTVKQTDTDIMYFVKDDSNLDSALGYEAYTAGTASTVAWSGVTGTPTTIAGYGITDAGDVAKAAAVADAIVDSVTDVAPSQNAVFDALALKQDASAALSDTDDLDEGAVNLYYTEGRVSANTDVAANTTKVSADGSVATHSDVSDAGSGIIISGAERTKLGGIEALATADQTGAEIKSAYEAEADTNAYDDAAVSKLGGIEALADVTDAANVAAAGATMDSDASLAGNSYFLDEDNMASDSATQVPSQQSVKAYVDAQAAAGGNLSAGDIKETSFSAANNQAAAADVTGLAFANGTVRSFKAQVSILIDATADLYEVVELQGIQKGASWDMSIEATGDDSNIVFSITSAGQIQYTSGNEAGFVSNSIKFRADTTSV